MKRCINIDWLEVYCLEPSGQPHDADYFESQGWHVSRRPYGTRVYDEMFTLFEYATDEPFIEVRRAPVGAKFSSSTQIIDPDSCHIRLHNRTCYYNNAAELLAQFLRQYNYQFMRISRIDLCLDFEYFDSLDDPQRFIQRYLSGRYAKLFQTNVRAIGKDMWDGRFWNSISWGSPKSQISTKIYNKTLELKESKDKPYIRQAWAIAGLVDDFQALTKTNAKGEVYKPVIWRLEFSIKSGVKNWFVLDHDRDGKPFKRADGRLRKQSVQNTLDCYFTRASQLNVFASLVDHYFRFKKVQEKPAKSIALMTLRTEIQLANAEKILERKDRCPDKVLFKFGSEQSEFYEVERPASATPTNRHDLALLRKLQEYKVLHSAEPIQNACDILIHDIRGMMIRKNAALQSDLAEIALLQQLVSLRLKAQDKQSITVEDAKAIMTIFDDLTDEEKAVQ